MKKRDYILFGFTILCIIFSSLTIYFTPAKKNAILQIRINDKIYGEYNLNEDQSITINDTNTCIIKNNKVTMTHASCPDQICVHSKPIDQRGGSILCLPNRVILEIITKQKEVDTTT